MERDILLEQRINIKFLVKLGKSGQEIIEMLQRVYGEATMKRPTIYKWIKRFKEGRDDVEDDTRTGRPATSIKDENIQRVHDLVIEDRRITTRMISERLGISKGSVQTILRQELGMRKLCAKIVPKLLSPEQKMRRVACCTDWLQAAEDADFCDRVITGDESWIYEYDPETKRQSLEWKRVGEPRSKKARKSQSKIKTMVIVFFDIRGVVHHEFVPEGQTVTAAFYVTVLKRLRDRVRRVRPELFTGNRWILHHDNAPSHTALVVRDFIARNNITVVDHPPYSPDLAPNDFFLFPKVKMIMRGAHFGDVQRIRHETTKLLKGLSENDFQHCFQQWKIRWQKCITSQGDYFEGDRMPVRE